MKLKKQRVLYFIKGSVISNEIALEAAKITPLVGIRNAELHVPGAGLEKCVAVAGPDIPEDYSMKYPKVSSAEELAAVVAGLDAGKPSEEPTPEQVAALADKNKPVAVPGWNAN